MDLQIKNNLRNINYPDINDFYERNGIITDEEYNNIIRAGISRPRLFLKLSPNEKWHKPFIRSYSML